MSLELTARSGFRPRVVWWWGGLGALALSVVLALRTWHIHDGSGVDLSRTVGIVFPAMLLVGATASHYAASGLALQAAAGVRLPAKERYLSQLAAAAANRVTPGGVGAAALNARYLTQRGTTAAGAVAAIGALQVLGALADVTVLATLIGLGTVLGIAPAGGWMRLAHEVEFPLRAVAGHRWVVVAAIAALTVMVGRHRRARSRRSAQEPAMTASVIGAITELRRRPRDVAALMGASAWTTVVLGMGFTASVAVVAGPGIWHRFLALVIGYLLGSAVGNAAPVPSGIGTTDTALVGVVAASGIAMHEAVVAVVIFRVVSFWIPAALGLAAGAVLRRRGAY